MSHNNYEVIATFFVSLSVARTHTDMYIRCTTGIQEVEERPYPPDMQHRMYGRSGRVL